VVDDAELHPHGARADLDRLVDVRAGRVGAAEDVDDVDAVADLVQGRDAALTVDLRARRLRVDRDDPVAPALEERGDPVAVAVRARRAADDRPRERARQKVADRVVERGGGDAPEDRPERAATSAPRGAGGDVTPGGFLPGAALFGRRPAFAERDARLAQRLAGQPGGAAQGVVVVGHGR
jgi:hypothetical protein